MGFQDFFRLSLFWKKIYVYNIYLYFFYDAMIFIFKRYIFSDDSHFKEINILRIVGIFTYIRSNPRVFKYFGR